MILKLVVLFLLSIFSTLLMADDNGCLRHDRCIFAVFPHTDFHQIEDTYSGIVQDISLIVNKEITLQSAPSMQVFANRLTEKSMYIALAGPGQYVLYGKKNHFIPLARRQSRLSFVLITNPNSLLNNADDALHARLGIMRGGTTSFILAQYFLKKHHFQLADIKTKNYASQRACIQAVVINKVDSCIVAEPILAIVKTKLGKDFRVLERFPALPSAVYLAHPDMPKNEVKAIKQYFLSREGFVAAKDSDYDVLRNLMATP